MKNKNFGIFLTNTLGCFILLLYRMLQSDTTTLLTTIRIVGNKEKRPDSAGSGLFLTLFI